ncbi:RNA polymerase sigma factor [Pedobacter glucosidilyticus]|uniref:RNA polymerase sigma factor n=1 Tax=Pedobacter glucosidilyticus TaxID=1122941 RepID=UPI00040B33D9|nr:sigma-70 family RNA polymerase sigma factor [Pedobacter glucosidilyticus]
MLLSHKEEDKLLLLQMQENDDNLAFDTLYDKYWEQMYNAAYKRLKDADYAKDITQDIFLQLWLRRKELSIDNLVSYLHTSVRNNVFKWMEKEQRYTPIPEVLIQLGIAKDQTDAEILRKEFLIKYERLINSLTPSQQEIFRMKYQEDLTTQQIADKLQISRKTVQNQLGKSMAQLRESLGPLYLMFLLQNL